MIFGAFIGMAIGLYFGVPILPLLVAFAVLQGGVAYAITRSQAAIRFTLPVAMAAFGTFLLVPMLTEQPTLIGLPFPLEWFTYATYVIAAAGLIGSTIVGLIGGSGGRSKTVAN